VDVVDFGIRGMDLAYALGEGYDLALLLDAAPRGEPPGTLSVIEPEVAEDELAVDAHAMHPVAVLALARALGGRPPRTLVVACEPQTRMTGDEPDLVGDLSEPVRAALVAGERLVLSLLEDSAIEQEVRPS
jgi:hydrogenase maturation protease